jgi:hypothetical protein
MVVFPRKPVVKSAPVVDLGSIEAMVVVMLFVLQVVQRMNLQRLCEC